MQIPSCKNLWPSLNGFIGKFGQKNQKSLQKNQFFELIDLKTIFQGQGTPIFFSILLKRNEWIISGHIKWLLDASWISPWSWESCPNLPLEDKCKKSYKKCAIVWFECMTRKPFSIAFYPCLQLSRWRTFSCTYLTKKIFIAYFCCLTLALSNLWSTHYVGSVCPSHQYIVVCWL